MLLQSTGPMMPLESGINVPAGITLVPYPDGITAAQKTFGAATNGTIVVFAPFDEQAVLILDLRDMTARRISHGITSSTNDRYMGVCYHEADGCFYFGPRQADQIMRYDPSQADANSISFVGANLGTSVNKFGGIASVGDYLYLVPYKNNHVEKYHVPTGVYTQLYDAGTTGAKYVMAIVASNGKVYGGAGRINNFIEIDPNTDAVVERALGQTAGNFSYYGIGETGGNLTFLPFAGTQVYQYELSTGNGISFPAPAGTQNFFGCASGANYVAGANFNYANTYRIVGSTPALEVPLPTVSTEMYCQGTGTGQVAVLGPYNANNICVLKYNDQGGGGGNSGQNNPGQGNGGNPGQGNGGNPPGQN